MIAIEHEIKSELLPYKKTPRPHAAIAAMTTANYDICP
eukprot:CAMPEP_0194756674 /NCGR_PEP_ID=MMETSP0323_2-20130528/10331_1 /TAXON_ID=2866 ORGANISM="Crypthecodinium cohnii, Strain Seligo" /NCGR_SAMPLE_ID=MMETSP0323_2 /ASSEMBLY_ACC=CAM_ASM_000346 /LENGTH=37 /DNA_ID= /DNA_START= /DNA_END= /DNA_ORIENTATION=